jgi:hypothetical protein
MSEWMRTRAEDHARRWEKLLQLLRRLATRVRIEVSSRLAIAKAQRRVRRKIKNQGGKGSR